MFDGHKLSSEDISSQKSKVEAIQNIEAPSNVAEVLSLLGMVNFRNKYINDYSTITAPLWLLTKNRQRFFFWGGGGGTQHHNLLATLKERLTSTEVMVSYNPGAEIKIIVDGSPDGLGAILAQKRPDSNFRQVAYGFKALSHVQQWYSQT